MLLILGLDGGTWRLLTPWMEQGKLPNLARLRRQALWGELQAVPPAATMPNWTTFMTGVNPGRHGIFDFTQRVAGSYEVRFVNGTYRKVPTVWRLLSDAAMRVAVLGLPGTYPPEPVNGCMISGFDAPVTTRANRSFIHPPELADEVMRLGGFSFADFQEFEIGAGWYDMALERLLEGIRSKGRLARALLRREPWDCFALIFGESDTVAHHFWHFFDPASPRHRAAEARAHAGAIERVYRAIDDVAGELIELAGEGASVLVASDHGFGGASDRAVYLNRWLAEHGWLRFRDGGGTEAAAILKRAAFKLVPSQWQAALFRSFEGRIASRVESGARFAGIHWGETVAYSEELNYFPNVWINRAGREPLGAVADGEYMAVCDRIRAELLGWRDPETGNAVVRNAWHRTEIYDGPSVDAAPDLLLELNETEGYAYSCLGSQGRPGPSLRRLEPAELHGGKRLGMSGSHRPEGVFLVRAPDVAPETRRAQMVDMAPTILALCGLTPPGWMEGEVLLPPHAGDARPSDAAAGAGAQVYSVEEERALEDRLRALGYIG